MNKNGFAISTLLYGISLMGVMIVILMMSIMSTNRKNTSTMVRDIEEELNRMSLTNTAIDTPGANKPYVVPEEESGWYKIQLWGAEKSKKGAYTSGIIYLDAGQKLYFTIGEKDAANPNSYVYVTNDTNTDMNNKSILSYSYIMRAGGGNAQVPAHESPAEATTGSFIAGYPGVISYKPSITTHTTHPYMDGYAPGDMNFIYQDFLVNDDDHIFGPNNTKKNFAFLDTYMVPEVKEGNGLMKIEKISSNARNNPPIALTTKPRIQYLQDVMTVSTGTATWRDISVMGYYTADDTLINSRGTVKNLLAATTDPIRDNKLASTTTAFGNKRNVNATAGFTQYSVGIYHAASQKISSETLKLYYGATESESWPISMKNFTETGVGINYSLARASAFGFKVGEFPDSADFWISRDTTPDLLVTSSLTGNTFLSSITDSQAQKWHIEKVAGKNYYKIVETSKNYSLRIDDVDEEGEDGYANAENNTKLSTNKPFNGTEGLKEERWILQLADDQRYFKIKSASTKTRKAAGGGTAKDLYLAVSGTKLVVSTTPHQFMLKNQSY